MKLSSKFDVIEWGYYLLVAFAVGLPEVFFLSLDTVRNYMTILSLCILALSIPVVALNKSRFSKSSFFYLGALILCIIFGAFRSHNLYHYSLKNMFYALRQYVWIFLYFPVLYIFKAKDYNMIKALGNVLTILNISLLFRTLTWAMYTLARIEIFPTILREFGDLWYRNDSSIRIDGTPLIMVGVLISVYLYFKLKKAKYLVSTFYILLYILMVNQTRVLVFSILVSVFFMYLAVHRDSKVTLKNLVAYTAIIVSVFVVSIYGYRFFMQNSSASDMGIGYRYWELNYYLSLLSDGNWKSGLGILTATNPRSYAVLYGHWDTRMYLDDLGIFELFFQFGLVSIFMYGYLVWKTIQIYRKYDQEEDRIEKALLIGLASYLVLTAVSLNAYGIQRSFSLSIILAILFFLEQRYVEDVSFKKQRV
jgi:hypothetical protein